VEKGEFVADIIILGAGLTGLSAAFHLEQLNVLDYKIFEKKRSPRRAFAIGHL
jgi:cation diffusion facilitator CzcD-associated flavoprotein CzcO